MEPEAPITDDPAAETPRAGGSSEDPNARALERDLELLETKAKHGAVVLARKIAPSLAAVLLVSILAWYVGRRLRA